MVKQPGPSSWLLEQPDVSLPFSRLQGRGLLLAWGCLPSFTPPPLPTAGWGPWAWLRPLWPQCEGRAGDGVGVFKNKPTAGKPTGAGPGWAEGEGAVRGRRREKRPGLGVFWGPAPRWFS